MIAAPDYMGPWKYYNIGSTTLKALKSARIIPQKDYVAWETKKPDVITAIEYKQPSQLKTKKRIESAIRQELGIVQVLGAKLYIVTDGQRTFWINSLTGNSILSSGGKLVATVLQ